MTSTVITRHRRSSSLPGTRHDLWGSLAAWTTTALLALILFAGPVLVGGVPFWARLPLLVAVALLLAVQGMRLMAKPPAGAVRRLDAIDLSVLFFVFYAAARWLTSPAEYYSRIEVMQVAACAGIFLTCRYGMANRKYCMLLLYLLVALGAAEVMAGYYLDQHPEWAPWNFADGGDAVKAARWIGTYESPNHFASFLIMAMSAALALGCFSKLPWPARIVFIYAALVMLVGILWSGSRGGWLALVAAIAGLVVMGIRHGTMRWWWPVAAAAVLAGVALSLFASSPVVQTRIEQTSALIADRKPSAEPRFELLRASICIARDNPVFGTGPATFEYVFPRYRQDRFDFYVTNSHNDYLNVLDDYGLVGFALCIFFVAAITLKYFRPLDADSRWQDRTLVATGFAAWLALLVHSLVDFNLHIPANALLFFALTGLAMARFRKENETHWSTVSLAAVRPWPGVALLVASVVFGAATARSSLSAIAYQQAFTHATDVPVDVSIAGAERALRYDANNEPALMFLGNLHRFRATHEAPAADKISDGRKALAAYERALRADSLNDVLQVRVGMGLDLVGKFDEALPHYQAAVTDEPWNGRFWLALSEHDLACGMTTEAARLLRRARACPFAAKEISDADRDLHGLPGSEEALEAAARAKAAALAPAPAPPPPQARSEPPPPVDVITVPAADHPEASPPQIPSSIIPDDEPKN